MSPRISLKPKPPTRLTRRSVLKSVGVAAGLALSNIVPRFVHAEPIEPAHQVTPHWDQVIQHVARSSPHEDRDVSALLLDWIGNMVLCPSERREALVVHGPGESGKTALHNAMSTLVGQDEYLHGCDEHWLLDWGLQPGRRLAAYERGKQTLADRRRRDNALSKQVQTMKFEELLFHTPVEETRWTSGQTSHRNSLWWYEAVQDDTPFSSELPTRLTKWKGHQAQKLELHFYLGKVEKPIPRLDLVRYLQDESAAFTERLRYFRQS